VDIINVSSEEESFQASDSEVERSEVQ
jgi:hypothetical protein